MSKPSPIPCRGHVLITGASAGIGEALAHVFAQNGHGLILVARSAQALDALAETLRRDHGVEVVVVPLDLCAAGATQQLCARVAQLGLEVEVLVNNAGVLHRGAFTETAFGDQQGLVQLNIGALTELTHLFLPGMVQRGRGRILNMASSAAFQPMPWVATYGASKAYVLSFSEALAIELQGSGVAVSALCPGFTQTAMIAQQGAKTFKVPLLKNATPQSVAAKAYAVCMAGKPVHIHGVFMRCMILMGQHLPRWMQRRASAMFVRGTMR